MRLRKQTSEVYGPDVDAKSAMMVTLQSGCNKELSNLDRA